MKDNIASHLQGKRHAKGAKALNEKKKEELKLEKRRARRKAVKARMKEMRLDKKLEEYKQKLASENEISSREFILIKEFEDGNMKQVCSLCGLVVPNEDCIKSHLSRQKHKAAYKRYSK